MAKTPHINYEIKHIEVTDLQCKDYLEVDLSKFSRKEMFGNFDSYSAKFIAKAKKTNLPQIRLKFPYEWDGFAEILKKFSYQPGLIFIEKDILGVHTFPENLTELTDTAVLKDILRKQQDFHYNLNSDFFEKTEKFDLDGYLSELQTTYVIYEKDKLIAFISLEKLDDAIYVNELFTDAEFRGRGLGKTLMQACFSYTSNLNIKRIWTTLAAQNELALHFYQACGFRPISKLFYVNIV